MTICEQKENLPKLTNEELELAMAKAQWFREVNKGKIPTEVPQGLRLILGKYSFELVLEQTIKFFQREKTKGINILERYSV